MPIKAKVGHCHTPTGKASINKEKKILYHVKVKLWGDEISHTRLLKVQMCSQSEEEVDSFLENQL